MCSLVVLSMLLAVVASAPQVPNYPYPDPRPVIPIAILRSSQDSNFDGTFTSDYETENGISNQVNGYVKVISPEEQVQVMQGQYSYTAPDGTPIITRWFADETGFHVEGAHLPVAPPVPEAIAKSLAYLASLPPTPAPAPTRVDYKVL